MNIKLIIFTVFITLAINSKSQNLITNEVLQKVFFIKNGSNTGTCFLVSIENNDYLITAKHLFFPAIKSKSQVYIELYRNDGWVKFNPTLLIHDNPNIDIAVLDLKSNDLKENLFDLDSKGYYLSQECFFLGFPFGLKMKDKEGELNNGFPIPFVKKGIISSFITDPNNMTQIFLDGHNNKGFSGGPVVVTNYGTEKKYKMKIIGVVSGYLNASKVVKTPIGDFINKENSGIVLTYAIDHVYEIINKSNPYQKP